MSFHVSIVATSMKGWLIADGRGLDEICEKSWFVGEDDRWSMASDWASTRFVGDFWFVEKNSR
jgi:hypothetical protein